MGKLKKAELEKRLVVAIKELVKAKESFVFCEKDFLKVKKEWENYQIELNKIIISQPNEKINEFMDIMLKKREEFNELTKQQREQESALRSASKVVEDLVLKIEHFEVDKVRWLFCDGWVIKVGRKGNGMSYVDPVVLEMFQVEVF